ncbi:MFS-type transporter involved in bile tolerance (Atg22 family) [Bradyrhizobium sp. GM24.11]
MTTIAPAAPMAGALRTYPPRAAVVSWIFFDWAAQPYFTLITTFVFAPYFATSIAPDPATGQSLWGFAMAAAGMAIGLLSPVLGAIADASGRRKPWIAAFGAVLVLASSALWIGKPGDHAIIPPLLIAVALASVGAEFATVFNNAMMPTLVPPERIGRLSGTGWATGYIGGIVSLIIVLGFLAANPETGRTLLGFTPLFGLDPATHEGDRAAGPLTGLWFIIFVTPMFLFTPDYPAKRPVREALHEGLADLKRSLKDLPQQKSLAAFLLANMIYTDGLVSLFAFGGIYAAGTFGWHTIQIGTFGIILAIAGTFGAWLGGKLDDVLGPKRVIAGSMLILLLAVAADPARRQGQRAVRQGRAAAAGRPAVCCRRRAGLYRTGLPDRRGWRPASGRLAHAADPPRAEGSYRAVFWSVCADREGDVLHRTAADRRDHRGNREPEGRHGRAGGVFRHGVRAADAGEGLVAPQQFHRRHCEERSDEAIQIFSAETGWIASLRSQ